ncbi:MAG: hypothetical protein AAF356_05325 [Planctomycetota bacterium]
MTSERHRVTLGYTHACEVRDERRPQRVEIHLVTACVFATDISRRQVCLKGVVAWDTLREHTPQLTVLHPKAVENRLSSRRDRQDIGPLGLRRLGPQPDERPIGVDVIPPQRSQFTEA